MYRGGNKDMKTKSSTLTAIGTILVKAYLDEKNNLQFKTVFGGFDKKCPQELKKNEIIDDIFKLNDKLKKRSQNNSDDEYQS